jgi:hypothetical protein
VRPLLIPKTQALDELNAFEIVSIKPFPVDGKKPLTVEGTQAKTQAVIIIEIPFQIHLSVIISPNHIKNIVHAVIVSIAINTRVVLLVSKTVAQAQTLFKSKIIQYD